MNCAAAGRRSSAAGAICSSKSLVCSLYAAFVSKCIEIPCTCTADVRSSAVYMQIAGPLLPEDLTSCPAAPYPALDILPCAEEPEEEGLRQQLLDGDAGVLTAETVCKRLRDLPYPQGS